MQFRNISLINVLKRKYYIETHMSDIIIYHNPRCSKSRQTLQLLIDHNVTPTIIEYLKSGVTKEEVTSLLSKLSILPRELMRTKDAIYKEQALNNELLTDEELINAIVKTPKLLERPIVVNNDKAAIGRPPESVLDII